jgi:hypothetical protein
MLDASCRSAALPPPPSAALPPPPSTYCEPACDSAPILCLANVLPMSDLDGRNVPNLSIGLQNHALGYCKPCAFFHTRGCENGDSCEFCHLCSPGEKKKRLKEKRIRNREELRAQFGINAFAAD